MSKVEINKEIKRFTGRRTRLESLLEMQYRWGLIYEHLLQDERFTTWWNENGTFTLKMRVNGEDMPVFQLSTIGALQECENPFLAVLHRHGKDPIKLLEFKQYVDQRPWIFPWIRPDTYEELFNEVMGMV